MVVIFLLISVVFIGAIIVAPLSILAVSYAAWRRGEDPQLTSDLPAPPPPPVTHAT